MLKDILTAALVLALIYAAAYLGLRRIFPPKDEAEMRYMNQTGRRSLIAIGLIGLASLVYWMMR